MSRFQFGVCEFSFPLLGTVGPADGSRGAGSWHAAGGRRRFHQLLSLNNKRVQESYLEAACQVRHSTQSIHLYTLVRQNYIRYSQSLPRDRSAWRASKRHHRRLKCTSPR